jgi:hypothetical protein
VSKNPPRVPGRNGHKPPPPVRTGRTRSTFDSCAVWAIGFATMVTIGAVVLATAAIRALA